MPLPPGQQAVDLANEFLTANNTHQAKNLRPLTWSAELAGIAQEWADNHARSNCGELPPHRPTSYLTKSEFQKPFDSVISSCDLLRETRHCEIFCNCKINASPRRRVFPQVSYGASSRPSLESAKIQADIGMDER